MKDGLDETAETANHDSDEISLIDLFAVLLKRRKMIISVTAAAAVTVLIVAILSLVIPADKSFMPNEYTPRALMLINSGSESSGGGLSSMIAASGMGGLASMAGVNASAAGQYGELAVFLCSTNTFLDAVVDAFGLIERYKIKKSVRADSRKALKENMSVSIDEDSGVFSLSFTDRDPEFARRVVNFAAEQLELKFRSMGLDKNQLKKENLEKTLAATFDEIIRLEKETSELETGTVRSSTDSIPRITLLLAQYRREKEVQETVYKQLRQEYELLKITMDSQTPVFQVIEYAEVPDKKSGPSRGMLCIIVTMAGGFFAVFLAFVLNAIDNIKKDKDAMSKLFPSKEK